MFAGHVRPRLASMNQIDAVSLNWSDLGVSELVPTGTVTLLLADVEGSTRLWETQPEEMTAAFANLDRALAHLVDAHHGVRPIEQGEGDSFVVAFGRASDAVACALDLQRAPLAPLRLRIGLHTGEVQLRDEANYIGPTINRTARLRDLAHGGQTVLSGTASDLVADRLPADAWLTDLGTHPVRDLPRPERVVQLCHPEIRNEFAPLRTSKAARSHNLPAQLTSFVGRKGAIAEVRESLIDNRLVTLTGAGGSGKTRLAIEVAGQLTTEFGDGVWCVDLSPITDPAVVPATLARTFGLPDQPGRSPMETVVRFINDRKILLLLDNCEHLLDVCGGTVVELLNVCPAMTLFTTSREPIGVTGEVTWRVPSLSVDDEAIALFTDRAQRVRPSFRVAGDDAAAVREICVRLDGMPLAIELAAARVRALSLAQIVDSLHDRFRLLTGGARTAVRRQQTLRASVDWSHALLTEPERTLFRRFSVFMAGFDLEAAQAVGASTEVEQFQILDQLSLLVDKSLVVADDISGTMRYRLLETVRQYALEKLGESGEADAVRDRHRDHYTDRAAEPVSAMHGGGKGLMDWADVEIDNLRAAFAWSRETGAVGKALRLASALQAFWISRARFLEGLAWFEAAVTDEPGPGVATDVWVRAVADQGSLAAWLTLPASRERAQAGLSMARQLGHPSLITKSLTACGALALYDPEKSRSYFDEAADLAQQSDNRQSLCDVRLLQAILGDIWGDPISARAAADECRELADALGDRFTSSNIRSWLGIALYMLGDLDEGCRVLLPMVEEGAATGDPVMTVFGNVGLGRARAFQGQPDIAHACGQAALAATTAMGGFHEDAAYVVLADAALAGGDGLAAKSACEASWQRTVPERAAFIRSLVPMHEALLACGELVEARRWADGSVAVAQGWHKMVALTARTQIALAQGEQEQAERDAYDALVIATHTQGFLYLPEIVECLARLAAGNGNHQNAARLFGAADAIRLQIGVVRFAVYQADYEAALAAGRAALGDSDFDAAWAEGTALSIEEAVAYAQRGRGERKRPFSGWESLTPTEGDVVRLVREGLSNAEVASRLFISPRTVQTHLTHVYAKLGLTSRVQLVQEAARHV
jgi:predicted ATPase/class 3 adenylate cyclase/DNA-binding CsgD family transcriptional regulator